VVNSRHARGARAARSRRAVPKPTRVLRREAKRAWDERDDTLEATRLERHAGKPQHCPVATRTALVKAADNPTFTPSGAQTAERFERFDASEVVEHNNAERGYWISTASRGSCAS